MASVVTEQRGERTLYRIQFRDSNRRRKSIRLGSLAKRDAKAISSRIESMVSCCIAGTPFPPGLSEWVASLGDDLHGKLATAGLIPVRRTATLGKLLDEYLDQHSDNVGERAMANLKVTSSKLTEFFGADVDVRSITADDVRAWRSSLVQSKGHRGKPFAVATIAGHVKRAKQLIDHAVELQCIVSNPFHKLRAGSQANDERKHHVPIDVIEKVINAAPDAEWRLLVALTRFAGLRNPSETLRLKWSDVNWAESRMVVTSPKTKHQGKSSRVVPVFASLRPYLEDAYENAEAGVVYCIQRYRSQDTNLRTQLERIVSKAGVAVWPRLWQNLRASAETDLVRTFPAHVAAAWLGHTPAVAVRHYLTVVDSDFQRAADMGVVQQVVHHRAELGGTDENPRPTEPREKQAYVTFPEVGEAFQHAQQDSNLRPTD